MGPFAWEEWMWQASPLLQSLHQRGCGERWAAVIFPFLFFRLNLWFHISVPQHEQQDVPFFWLLIVFRSSLRFVTTCRLVWWLIHWLWMCGEVCSCRSSCDVSLPCQTIHGRDRNYTHQWHFDLNDSKGQKVKERDFLLLFPQRSNVAFLFFLPSDLWSSCVLLCPDLNRILWAPSGWVFWPEVTCRTIGDASLSTDTPAIFLTDTRVRGLQEEGVKLIVRKHILSVATLRHKERMSEWVQ